MLYIEKDRVIRMMGDESSITEGQVHLVEMKKKNAREFMQVVKAVAFRETGTFYILEGGLKIIVDDQHCEQAIAYLSRELFASIVSREANVCIRLNLASLIDSLSILDDPDTTLKMLYDGYGEPLRVLVEHEGKVVDASINTLTNQHMLDFDFDNASLKARFISKAGVLKDAFREFDRSSPTVLFVFNRNELSMQTHGDIGKVTTTIPATSEYVEVIECDRPCSFSYRLSLLRKMEKALYISSRISLRCDTRGIISLQFMVDAADRNNIFIEFFCVPDNEEVQLSRLALDDPESEKDLTIQSQQ